MRLLHIKPYTVIRGRNWVVYNLPSKLVYDESVIRQGSYEDMEVLAALGNAAYREGMIRTSFQYRCQLGDLISKLRAEAKDLREDWMVSMAEGGRNEATASFIEKTLIPEITAIKDSAL